MGKLSQEPRQGRKRIAHGVSRGEGDMPRCQPRQGRKRIAHGVSRGDDDDPLIQPRQGRKRIAHGVSRGDDDDPLIQPRQGRKRIAHGVSRGDDDDPLIQPRQGRKRTAHGVSRGDGDVPPCQPRQGRKRSAHGVSRGNNVWLANSPGRGVRKPSSLPRSAKNESLVVFHAVFFEQPDEFLGKADAPVVFPLPRDVSAHRFSCRLTDAERAVPRLPRKPGVGACVRAVKPQRGVALEQPHQSGQCHGGRMSQQQMDMVRGAVDRQRHGIGFTCDAAEIRVCVGTHGVVEPGTPFLRGKHDVDKQERQGVGHADFLTPLPGLCPLLFGRSPRLTPWAVLLRPCGAGNTACFRPHGSRRGLSSCAPAGAGNAACLRPHGSRRGLSSCAPAGAV